MSSTTMGDKRFTKHGFPKGFRFVPTNLELITILSHRIDCRWLPPKVAGIFHDLTILDHHPEELHDMYEHYKEDRYIYFFSLRQHQGAAGGGPVHKKRQRGAAGGQDEDDDNEPRPVRLARGGGWKPSGGGQELRWPKDKGGLLAGKMVTMVFYDHRDGNKQEKSQWGMHEFTVPADQRQLSKPAKARHWHKLALYRLYRLSKGGDDMEGDDGAGSNLQTMANVAAADGRHLSAPCPAGQPSLGIFPGRNQNQPLPAGASTSRMPPPQLQQQHRIPNVGHPQYYHHHQYAFGAAPPASAAHHQVRTMTMPPAYGTELPPGPQLIPFARPPGTVLPAGRQSFQQFARAPAPPQMPVPPAAANPASHQQAPAKSATHGDAGQEASGNFGPMRSSQDTTATATAMATAKTGQQVQFADCVKPEEERMAPPIEDFIPADSNDGIGMPEPEWDLDLGSGWMFEDDRFLFTMDELFPPTLDEPQPTQQGDDN